MRKLPTILSILLLFCFATTLNAQITSCGSTTRNFSASLLGGNIAGAQNGFGNVALTFDSGNATVRSSTLGLNNITGITLFRGNPASGGTAVMTFTDFANNFQAGNFSRTLPVDQTLAADISANPQNFFFVITTTDFPQGAVSGPLATSNLNPPSSTSETSFAITAWTLNRRRKRSSGMAISRVRSTPSARISLRGTRSDAICR